MVIQKDMYFFINCIGDGLYFCTLHPGYVRRTVGVMKPLYVCLRRALSVHLEPSWNLAYRPAAQEWGGVEANALNSKIAVVARAAAPTDDTVEV